MKYTITIILLLAAFLMTATTGCAQNRNMTRNDTVVDEEPIEDDGESYSFEDESGLNPDELGSGDDGWEESQDTEQDDFLTGAAGGDGNYDETGNASWYGRAFHGRQTASGEKFDMYELSAAHRKYPFGTVLQVKNLDNGKSVQVRVNDRGPYADGRILDVSYAAGRDLGMLATGTARVGIKVVSGDGQEADNVAAGGYGNVHDPYDEGYGADAPQSTGAYMLQCGAFYSKNNADSLRERIQRMFQNRVIVFQENDLYKVRILDIPSKQEAERFKQLLADDNIPGYVIQN
ncbi:MAG: septal ring lytic transglycosylase RlpA family protein [Spirochaetota bacterium]